MVLRGNVQAFTLSGKDIHITCSYDIVDDSYECRSKFPIKNKRIIKHSPLI